MRELLWMHAGWKHERWNHTAKICETMFAVNGKQVDPQKFMPPEEVPLAEMPATEEEFLSGK